MPPPTPGIHHVTAIAGPAQRNLDFYAGILGLRLVKRTVNFDDPQTYHLYYGDAAGRPGTIFTVFPWTHAARGRGGPGMATATSFAVPAEALPFWKDWLGRQEVAFDATEERFGRPVLRLSDPDGLALELVADPAVGAGPAWEGGPVPPEHAVRGIHAVTLCVEGYARTAELLTEVFGWRRLGSDAGPDGERTRFVAPSVGSAAGGSADSGTVVDLRAQPNRFPGRMGAGTVHHVAFRARDDAEQDEWRRRLVALGFDVTPVIDREYFHSIYFREPGGVLFEIATDPPGFTADESLDALGAALKLPPKYESRRAQIERVLPPLQLPDVRPAGGLEAPAPVRVGHPGTP